MGNAHWLGRKSRCIEQRIVVEGELVLQTPAHFGDGNSDNFTDMPLLVDAADGLSPLLTGATLGGALRAYLWSREQGDRQADPKPRVKPITAEEKSLTEVLFGGFKQHDDGEQSALIVDDARSKTYSMQFRDGVRLDPQTRTAYIGRPEGDDGQIREKGHLFDMQVWSAGTSFPIRLELLLSAPKRDKDEADDVYEQRKAAQFTKIKKALLMALQGLSDGGITLGGRKNRGYGRITVNNWHVKTFDLMSKTGLVDWLETGNRPLQTAPVDKLTQTETFKQFENEDLTDRREYFRMEATFKLDGSLLIRANGLPGSHSPDMVHLSDHEGKPVLSGTSVAGALRQRARRILNLVNPNQSSQWLDELFGNEKMENRIREGKVEKHYYASRLIVEETQIMEPQFDLVQNRVAIDRFTGGALDTALFNEQPVFGRPDTRLFINITVRQPEKRDIGLLLLLLKDLWTGDLPLGGEVSVGRGRLAGETAVLTYKQTGKTEEWRLIEGENKQIRVETESVMPLQLFVDALHGKEVAHES
jgi:CRISPR/Cas system CSM-associated protein Csm3 (group 7 of RAMP superfamily)